MSSEKESTDLATLLKRKPHAMADAIDGLLHRVQDIETAARRFVPAAAKLLQNASRQIDTDLDDIADLVRSDDKALQIQGIKRIDEIRRRVERLSQSRIPALLENSLFQSLFSAYDAFTGDLLRAVYLGRPELFSKLQRQVPVAEILKHSSFEEFKAAVLESEIESFRRKSYAEQFADLETTFGLKLTAFEQWPAFVEAGQRRNLLTHCDGIVSGQYLSSCAKVGYKTTAAVGDRISLDAKYVLSSITLIMEVAVKLGQTLWRKLIPGDVQLADTRLNDIVYDFLRYEQWERAAIFGHFAVGLPRHASDVNKRVAIVNLVIALKAMNRIEEATAALDSVDWSASAADFRLAEAVLRERYADASKLMRAIGKSGDFVSEQAYHVWPLFRDFRGTESFQQAYEHVYGYPFLAEVQRSADATRIEARETQQLLTKAVEQQRNDLEEKTSKQSETTSTLSEEVEGSSDRSRFQ
jgi:hypothetical protein